MSEYNSIPFFVVAAVVATAIISTVLKNMSVLGPANSPNNFEKKRKHFTTHRAQHRLMQFMALSW